MSKRILVVEDDHDILGLLKDVLENEGYEVTGLAYTDAILQSISKYQPDLVMLDFLLPGVNGGELCHDIKSNVLTSRLPVIMLSAFPRVLESLGDFGADAFIAKPFDLTAMLHTVSACFDDNLAMA
jgi:DNA-binding response OmpR family regulator